MGKALKRQLKVQKDTLLFEFVFCAAGVLTGVLLFALIMHTDETTNSYFPLGTLMGTVFTAIFAVMIASGVRSYFNMEVSMGATRSEFFWSYYAVAVIGNLLCTGLLMLACQAEMRAYGVLYQAYGCEFDIWPYLLKFGIPVSAALPVVGMFVGAMIMKYGMKAFWIFWALWMFGFAGAPRIAEAAEEAPGSLFGIIGSGALRIIKLVPGNIWFAVIALVCVVLFAVSFAILRRQQVA